jgi:vancomycin permeability regulator SanA
VWVAVAGAIIAGIAVAGSVTWTRIESAGHIHPAARAPRVPVVVVFGAQLAPGGTRPKPFLAGRLDVAAQLISTGRARAVLVSGDARGASGDEVAAMTGYLRERGVPAHRIVADPYGLDSYDTCARAARVYGIRRALLVTQAYHLPRAVTLCRGHGIDAHGVQAGCAGCPVFTRAVNIAREGLADVKAVGDALRRRPAKVGSPADPAVTNALR